MGCDKPRLIPVSHSHEHGCSRSLYVRATSTAEMYDGTVCTLSCLIVPTGVGRRMENRFSFLPNCVSSWSTGLASVKDVSTSRCSSAFVF